MAGNSMDGFRQFNQIKNLFRVKKKRQASPPETIAETPMDLRMLHRRGFATVEEENSLRAIRIRERMTKL
jgi:hypothetical protein